MNIRNGIDSLGQPGGATSVKGVSPGGGVQAGANLTSGTSAAGAPTFGTDQASVSSAGQAASAAGSDVRMEKVSEIQNALATGSYNVAPSAVAAKLVDAMLGNG